MNLFNYFKSPKVNFLIIGTQKSGTSALDYFLRQHPKIEMAVEKELHFFDDENIFSKSKIDYKELENKFNYSDETKLYGEATPIYMYWDPCIERIYNYNKNIKLIVILRNPIDRAFSHWNMEVDRNAESKDFLYCIKNEKEIILKTKQSQHRIYSYTDRGLYIPQMNRILKYFNRNQIHFIKYEEFLSNPENVLNDVFHFLNINKSEYLFKNKQVHNRPYKREMTSEEREYLINFFSKDTSEVEKLLNWDCSDWKL